MSVSPPPSDGDLIQSVAEGDQFALRELYDRFAGPIYAQARHFTGNSSDAEEVLQDVFTAVWTGASTFDGRRSAPFTWLVCITRHKSIDRLRKSDRRLPSSAHFLDTVCRDHADPDGDPTDAITAGETASAVKGWLAELPAEQSRSLLLSFFEGMTHREIAEEVGIPLGTVKSRIRLALETLREKIRGRDPR